MGARHWLRTLTVQHTLGMKDLPSGVPPDSVFVVLERCAGNLRGALALARALRDDADKAPSPEPPQAATPMWDGVSALPAGSYAAAACPAPPSAAVALEASAGTAPAEAPLPAPSHHETLRQKATEWGLPHKCYEERFLVNLARQLVSAVAFLHDPGRGGFVAVAHGNLKPSNVLLRNGVIKLSEFDPCPVSAQVDAGEAAVRQAPVSPWRPHEGLPRSPQTGTSGAPPPTASAGGAGGAGHFTGQKEHVDVFGLGCLIFFVLTLGDHPFGGTTSEQVKRIKLGAMPALSQLRALKTAAGFEAADLVGTLLDKHTVHDGTVARQALWHPLFWDVHAKFRLITNVSEGLEVNQTLVPNAVQRAFATALQGAIQRHLGGARGWHELMAAPPGAGPDGWGNATMYPFKTPEEYEGNYAGPFSNYSLVRFVRNLYVHGASHVRVGLFTSVRAITHHVLRCFPWLPLVLWQVDQAHGGHFTQAALATAENPATTAAAPPAIMVSHKRLLSKGRIAFALPASKPSGAPQAKSHSKEDDTSDSDSSSSSRSSGSWASRGSQARRRRRQRRRSGKPRRRG